MCFYGMGSLGVRISSEEDVAFTDIPESSICLSNRKLHVYRRVL